MGMRRKMGRGGADKRRTQSKYEESDASDDDYKVEEEVEYDDSDEYCSSLAEEELENDIVDVVEEKKLRVSKLKRRNSRGRVGKACKKRKVSHKEYSDEDYLDDGVDEVEVSKDWGTGFPRRKRNGAKKVLKEKKASHMEDQNDECEAEDDGDEYYNANKDDVDLWKVFPRRKRNGVKKPVKKKKAAYVEENDDAYKTEDDECDDDDDDDDYNDNEDEKELHKCCPTRKNSGIQKVLKKKKDSSEEDDDDYKAEDDDCDDEDDYVDNEDEKDLPEESPTRKENRVQKALKKKKAAYTGESDDDYEVEDDEYDDEDDDENGEEEEDEDLTSDEIDFDDEDEVVVKRAKKVRHAPHGRLVSGGQKKRSNSKRKPPAKRRGCHREISSSCHKEATREKSRIKATKLRSSGPKRRRLIVDSDSDFVDEPLLVGEEYTISEEEREQVQEASRFCGQEDVTPRNSSTKRSRKEANLPQEREHKARKGKDKVEESKNEVAKQICGICLSEEGKRTVRGALDCCNHYFCFHCIIDWSKVETRCPLCKQRFSTITKLGRSDTASDSRTTVISVPERDQVYQPSEEELRAYLDPYENVICIECHHGGDDANMLLCDLCDSPAHTYCVGLTEVPEGNWYCEGCRPTVLGPSIPEVARSSPSENVRVAIDLNRAYEPETPLDEGIGISSSPRPAARPVDGDLRAGYSTLGAGVQTVSERRRRHQMAHFTTRIGANVGLGPEVEWGRTRRLVFQNATRPAASAFDPTFSQGLLHAGEYVRLGPHTSRFHTAFSQGSLHNFVSPAPSMDLFPAAPSNSGARRVWGQTFTGVSSSANGNGLLPPGIAGIRSGDAWSNYGHSPMQ